MIKAPTWRDFPTQDSLRAAVREVVNPQPFDTPFASALISDLNAERHYFCSLRNLRPGKFKKTREDQPYRFQGLFDHGWHLVSWTKCVSPPPTKQDLIIRALRDRTESIKIAFRREHPVCARCGTARSEETHHADPTFQQIVDEVFRSVASADIDSALIAWNWFQKTEFAVPEDHIIIRIFDGLHASARLEALCQPCHRSIAPR
ncbi:MAG: hypothetical protein EXS37_08745 [Opitutus sp.]|nr:hypothetical protein [Opitutus sp.]